MKTLHITYNEFTDFQSGKVSPGIELYLERLKNQLREKINLENFEFRFYLASQVSRPSTMNMKYEVKIDTNSKELRNAFDTLEPHFIEVRIGTMF